MKSALSAILVTLIISAPALADSKYPAQLLPDSGKWVPQGSISSEDLRAINAAFPVFKERRPDWTTYRVEVIETGKSVIVEFWRPELADRLVMTGDEADAMERRHGGVVIEMDPGSLKILGVVLER